MIRLLLSDVMKRRLKSKLEILGVYQTDNLFTCIEGALWRVRTGCPWRDLPEFFGPWKTIYNRFNEWSKADIWNSLFVSLKAEIDTEWVFIDGMLTPPQKRGISPLASAVFHQTHVHAQVI